jgi:phosphopantothenoylcysteine decarboxylase/phosphopantothenate--cysteine ligase
MSLKNKRILITAGPTWVPIDKVRVISNTATGQTGMLLAEEAARFGAKTTLFLGPVSEGMSVDKKIRLIRFVFFKELKNRLIRELKSQHYDIVIHSAAVSDYQPRKVRTHKIKSDKKVFRISLLPTPKIIDLIRKTDRHLFLVGFKFEPEAAGNSLIKAAKGLMRGAGLNLVVANTINKGHYRAYIINQNKIYGPLWTKKDLTKKLINLLGH